MNAAAPHRLAVVLSHPNQYYSPWFRWLRARTALKFRVFYLWDFGVTVRRDPQFQAAFKWDVDLLSGYDHERVPNLARDPGMHHFRGLRNPELPKRLARWNPAALLVYGYNSAGLLRAIAWARLRGVPVIFRGDSHFLGRPPPRGWRGLVLRALCRQFAAVTYVGTANRAYFSALGVRDKRLFFVPHAVDAARFDPQDAGARSEALRLRGELGLSPEIRVVLFAGKLVRDKQPLELLAAFRQLAPQKAALVFVGDGPERPVLEAAAAGAGRPGEASIHLLPFANQTEMASRYLLADIFVLPSRGVYETWGLAVNEAMHLGVPCLVSDRVGCQQDLVTDGETGWVFRAEDPGHLREKLAEALAADRGSFKPRIAARIAGYTYEAATRGFVAAFNSLHPS